MPKSKQYVESSGSDSDSEAKSKKKVPKKAKREVSSEEEAKPAKKPKKETKKDDSEDNVWELGNNRRVTVREFKGKLYVDIREMYLDKEGDLKPGKKGISLNTTQWRKLVDVISEVDEEVKSKC